MRLLPLALVAILFWFLALSNRITLGGAHLLTIPLPEPIWQVLSVFRASGRFGWLLFYLLTLAIPASLFSRLPSRPLLALLVLALTLQLADMIPKYRALRQTMKDRQAWESPLKSPEWTEWAKQAKRLVIAAPHPSMEQVYLPFAHLAGSHGLQTNAVHMARAEECGVGENELAQGAYDPQTLYIFLTESAAVGIPVDKRSRLRHLDGYAVLPPLANRP